MTAVMWRRIAFTLGALLVYRLGTFIPLPGINLSFWSGFAPTRSPGVLELVDAVGSTGTARLTLFALGIGPYLVAAVLLQVTMLLSRRLRAPLRRGEDGRVVVRGRTLYLTLFLAALQGFGMASALEDIEGAVVSPGWVFRITTALSLAGGALSLAWLCEQITARGIGNGIALVLVTGMVTDLLPALARLMEASRIGALSNGRLGIGLIAVIALTLLIAAVEQAQRRIAVEYSARMVGTRNLPAQSSPLVFKLNSAGLFAAMVAGWFSEQGLQHPIGYPVLLVVFSMFYAAFLLDPDQSAKDLHERSGTIRAVDPGEPTAAYLDFVLSRIALIGALYLTFVCLLPEILVTYAELPVYFAGTSLLIAVCTVLDLRQTLAAYAR